MSTLAVRNQVQAALFEKELKGQLSDGMWENSSPREHWKPWCSAEVIVDPENVGRDFYADKDNYNFNSTFLLECVRDRMLALAQEVDPDLTMADLRRELKDLKTIVRTRRAVTV
jgi:hypothetical protein